MYVYIYIYTYIYIYIYIHVYIYIYICIWLGGVRVAAVVVAPVGVAPGVLAFRKADKIR